MKSRQKNYFRVLLIEDESYWRLQLATALRAYRLCRVSLLSSFSEAEEFIASNDLRKFHAVIIDVRLRAQIYDQGGLALLDGIKRQYPEMPILVLTAYSYDYPGLRETTNRYSRVLTYDKELFLQHTNTILDLLFFKAPSQIGDQKPPSNLLRQSYEARRQKTAKAKKRTDGLRESLPEGETSSVNFKEKRKNDLMENITRQYKLLHEYERKRDLSDRPKEIEAFNSEITAITSSLEDYIAQYHRICQDDNTPCSPEVASIWNEIQHLKQGQQLIVQKQDETLAAIDRIRHEISMKIEDSYRSLALNLLLALDEQEVRVVGAIIDGIEKNQLSEKEMAEALKAIQTGYAELQAKSLSVSGTTSGAEDTKQLPQVWNSPDLNAVGKLKLSIPLIPAILSYETELSVSVKQSLSDLWGRFFKGKQILI